MNDHGWSWPESHLSSIFSLILSGMGYRPESGADLNRYLELFVEQKKLVLDEGRYWLVARS